MCDLVSRSALIEEFRKSYCGHLGMENSDSMMSFKSICRKINNAPTVEAKPVVRGEWKVKTKSNNGYTVSITCSACGYSHSRVMHNFCPNCGADMRKESENKCKQV